MQPPVFHVVTLLTIDNRSCEKALSEKVLSFERRIIDGTTVRNYDVRILACFPVSVGNARDKFPRLSLARGKQSASCLQRRLTYICFLYSCQKYSARDFVEPRFSITTHRPDTELRGLKKKINVSSTRHLSRAKRAMKLGCDHSSSSLRLSLSRRSFD